MKRFRFPWTVSSTAPSACKQSNARYGARRTPYNIDPMHLVTCRHKNQERIGVLRDGEIVLLPQQGWPASMLEFIAAGPTLLSRLRADSEGVPLATGA